MQARDLGKLALTVIAALAAWELGQVLATYLVIGLYGENVELGFTPGNGFDQLDTLAVVLLRLVLAAVVAVPVLLLLGRALWRDRSR